MLLEFIGTPTFWGMITVLLSMIIFAYILNSYEASIIVGSVVLMWVSLVRLIPSWVSVVAIVVYSFLLGFAIISYFIPKGSGGAGSSG